MKTQLTLFERPIDGPDGQLDLAPGMKASRKLTRRMAADERRQAKRAANQSIAQRYAEFASKNPHVMDELLRLATARLERGETYISIKALWEELRVSLENIENGGSGTFETTEGKISPKLNNNFTAYYARALIRREPRLDGVIKLREQKR